MLEIKRVYRNIPQTLLVAGHRFRATLNRDAIVSFKLILICLAGFSVYSTLSVPRLVGDGREYYALFFAWSETFRPWMTETSYVLYDKLSANGAIAGILTGDWLKESFNQLRLDATQDFNHFWLYSFLASFVHWGGSLVGVNLGAHPSFLVLHGFLFSASAAIIYRNQLRAGIYSLVILSVSSPILWYIDKVHTEFFTYALTLAGISLVLRKRAVFAGVLFALAATQNPSFSFVAVILLMIRAWRSLWTHFSLWEVCGTVATVGLLALHPTYYLFRHGAVTPQMVAGGAAPGDYLDFWYIWFVDPNLGLLPNWPLGVVILAVGFWLWVKRPGWSGSTTLVRASFGELSIVTAVFVLASIYAQCSTTNLNSGATPGPARYALWYLPIFFPFLVVILDRLGNASRKWRLSALAIGVVGTLGNALVHHPGAPDDPLSPSKLSVTLQTWTPKLYDPPPEVFAERYGDFGEITQPVAAVVGPNCRKTLIFPRAQASGHISVPYECDLMPSQLEGFFEQVRGRHVEPTYLHPSDEQLRQQTASTGLQEGKWYRHDTTSRAVQFDGWSGVERNLRWSDGPRTRIKLAAPASGGGSSGPSACLGLKGHTLGEQTIIARLGDNSRTLHGPFDGAARLAVPVPPDDRIVRLTLEYSNPHRPNSRDPRQLAFALQGLRYDAKPCAEVADGSGNAKPLDETR